MSAPENAPSGDPPAALARHHDGIQAEMKAALEGRKLPIYDYARYALGWIDRHGAPADAAGKGARGALCMLAAEAVSADPEALARARCAAAAVEFVHNFSLVHDDVQDRDEERRGRPTVWKIWGIAQAINAGDALRELADGALRSAAPRGAPAERILDAGRRLNAATLRMIEGQYLDLTFEQRTDVSVAEYAEMVECKTGAMMGVSLALGALFAGAEPDRCDAFQRAGERLGRCFQLRDDWLGVWGDAAELGKSTDSDIRRKKKAHPALYAIERSAARSRRRLLEIYARESLSDADVEEVRSLFDEAGAGEATEAATREERDAFERALARCAPRPQARRDLIELADFTINRRR